MKHPNLVTGVVIAMLFAYWAIALAQSTGAFPADPNNARIQFPAPSSSKPTEPTALIDPLARIPTSPQDRLEASGQGGRGFAKVM